MSPTYNDGDIIHMLKYNHNIDIELNDIIALAILIKIKILLRELLK